MEEEMIENFDYIRLEVVDSWQLPAVYIIYKKGYELEDLKEDYFVKEVDEKEYKETIEKIKEWEISKWQYDYLPDRNEKFEYELMWKFMVCKDGRKFVKKGKNKFPAQFESLEDFMIETTYQEEEI